MTTQRRLGLLSGAFAGAIATLWSTRWRVLAANSAPVRHAMSRRVVDRDARSQPIRTWNDEGGTAMPLDPYQVRQQQQLGEVVAERFRTVRRSS